MICAWLWRLGWPGGDRNNIASYIYLPRSVSSVPLGVRLYGVRGLMMLMVIGKLNGIGRNSDIDDNLRETG